MKRAVVAAALALCTSAASAEPLPWYRGVYTRIGWRDSIGIQERFHAWAAFAFGLGYRLERGWWGVDVSVLNLQHDLEEGLHTLGRVVPYLSFERWTRADLWLGAGLSYGWVKGTVDQAIAKRKGEGIQLEVIAGGELPRALRARLFVQGTLTVPLYELRDPYLSRDSVLDVIALEVALGVRF
jgi:hypothetical protein